MLPMNCLRVFWILCFVICLEFGIWNLDISPVISSVSEDAPNIKVAEYSFSQL